MISLQIGSVPQANHSIILHHEEEQQRYNNNLNKFLCKSVIHKIYSANKKNKWWKKTSVIKLTWYI